MRRKLKLLSIALIATMAASFASISAVHAADYTWYPSWPSSYYNCWGTGYWSGSAYIDSSGYGSMSLSAPYEGAIANGITENDGMGPGWPYPTYAIDLNAGLAGFYAAIYVSGTLSCTVSAAASFQLHIEVFQGNWNGQIWTWTMAADINCYTNAPLSYWSGSTTYYISTDYTVPSAGHYAIGCYVLGSAAAYDAYAGASVDLSTISIQSMTILQ